MVTSKLSPSSNNSGQNNIDNTNLNNINNNNNNNKTALTSHSNHLNNNTNHNNLNKPITNNNHLTNLNPSNFTNNHKFNNLVNHNNNSNNNQRHSPLNHSGTKHVQQPNLSMPLQDPSTSLMQQQQRHHLNRLSLGKIKLGLLTHQQTQHKQSHKRFMERASRLILHDEQKLKQPTHHHHHHHMGMDAMEQYEELEEGEHKQPSKFRDENINLTPSTEADYAAVKASSSSLTLTKMIAAATSSRQVTVPVTKPDEDDLDDEYDDDDDNDDENTQLLSDYSGGGQQLINENDIRRIFAVSKSRGNFAALLVQQMYARHERIMSNVMGTRGKRQLSPSRMLVVKTLAFQMYPPPNEREEEMIWKKECVKAIDSKNRKVRINPGGGVYASGNTPKLDPTNPAFSQFLHLTSTPLSSGHLSRTTSASNTAALAAAVAAALSTKHQLLEQQHQQQQQQQQMHQTSPKQEPTNLQAKSTNLNQSIETPGGGGDEDMATEGETTTGAHTMEACPDLATSIPSNSSSSTTTNQNVLSDYSADR